MGVTAKSKRDHVKALSTLGGAVEILVFIEPGSEHFEMSPGSAWKGSLLSWHQTTGLHPFP